MKTVLPYGKDYPADKWPSNPNFSVTWENGQNVLYFKGKELREMGEHTSTLFENGVLLSFSSPTQTPKKKWQSYRFYNNDGKKVCAITNMGIDENPEFYVEIEVMKRTIKITRISYATGVKTELLYDIKDACRVETEMLDQYVLPI